VGSRHLTARSSPIPATLVFAPKRKPVRLDAGQRGGPAIGIIEVTWSIPSSLKTPLHFSFYILKAISHKLQNTNYNSLSILGSTGDLHSDYRVGSRTRNIRGAASYWRFRALALALLDRLV